MSETAAREFRRLVEVVAELRGPEGCPWDREQTLTTLRPFVLEETYEVLEAIDRGDMDALGEEIGDMVFEGVLLAQVAAEAGHFTISDSLRSITEKLVRRHPHVFGGHEKAQTAEEVLGMWEAAKSRERTGQDDPKTILGGVPGTLPALLAAYEMGTRASAVGFDWERSTDVLAKIQEEVDELRVEVERGADTPGNAQRIEEEMGDLLFAIANLSRKLGIEPESALRSANAKFRRRFTEMERRVTSRGGRLQDMTPEALDKEWNKTKTES